MEMDDGWSHCKNVSLYHMDGLIFKTQLHVGCINTDTYCCSPLLDIVQVVHLFQITTAKILKLEQHLDKHISQPISQTLRLKKINNLIKLFEC